MQSLDFSTLRRLAQASAEVTAPCSCITESLAAWQKLPLSLDVHRIEDVGTLLDDPYAEPTFAEYHPAGTHYDSADAPIAPRFYPFNRCTVARCMDCGRHYLRYNEAGGYFNVLDPEFNLHLRDSAFASGWVVKRAGVTSVEFFDKNSDQVVSFFAVRERNKPAPQPWLDLAAALPRADAARQASR